MMTALLHQRWTIRTGVSADPAKLYHDDDYDDHAKDAPRVLHEKQVAHWKHLMQTAGLQVRGGDGKWNV